MIKARHAPQLIVVVPLNLCSCPGCQRHIARLEDLNAQLARENDRLRRELEKMRHAA
jgi:hypothetical protein